MDSFSDGFWKEAVSQAWIQRVLKDPRTQVLRSGAYEREFARIAKGALPWWRVLRRHRLGRAAKEVAGQTHGLYIVSGPGKGTILARRPGKGMAPGELRDTLLHERTHRALSGIPVLRESELVPNLLAALRARPGEKLQRLKRQVPVGARQDWERIKKYLKGLRK